ncbi:SdrD B-like domain-containing protein [Planctomycetes bacterium Pan216]|uniref:SdrD B-like domain-containing protein n=1 Tax=Kolteria novifilia TaxID=2527975 RepID=UPI0011A41910
MLNGTSIRTTVTDAQGRYVFQELPAGAFRVREVQPSGFFDGRDHIGVLGDADDDASASGTLAMCVAGLVTLRTRRGKKGEEDVTPSA